jgi:hypothetical protein
VYENNLDEGSRKFAIGNRAGMVLILLLYDEAAIGK